MKTLTTIFALVMLSAPAFAAEGKGTDHKNHKNCACEHDCSECKDCKGTCVAGKSDCKGTCGKPKAKKKPA
ncbi:MAG: hypothetical protein HUU37_10320 [Bdellovibrionales bacterium]|nr:hypothetical protein [Bdellovibrionales bacterium]